MKDEQLGWRDARISQRHRLWGFAPPPTSISLRALANLASNSQIPAWVAEYDPDEWRFKLHPLNAEAWDYMEAHRETFFRLSEEQYVAFLHDLAASRCPSQCWIGCVRARPVEAGRLQSPPPPKERILLFA